MLQQKYWKEGYWKELTIKLSKNVEFTHVVQSENANCLIVHNSDISTIRIGTKPGVYDVFVPPKQVGIITRPFTIKYVYLFSDKKTNITLIETYTEKPVESFIQQETAKHVSVISTVGLTASELNRDNNLNVGVNIANAHDMYGIRWTEGTSTAAPLEVVLDTGLFGRPHVNIFAQSSASANFDVTAGNNPGEYTLKVTSFSIPAGGSIWKSLTISFRYIRVVTNAANDNYIQISTSR